MTDHAASDDTTRAHLETYYDLAPRANADTEEHGPLTLFLSRGGYPYYARPRLGLSGEVTEADVTAVLERQRVLEVPRAVEWVDEVTPSLLSAARAAGMQVEVCPLLVLTGDPVVRPDEVRVRLLAADDPDIGRVNAAIAVGFAHAGTSRGEAGAAERDEQLTAHPESVERTRALVASGRSVLAGAFDPDAGAVGGGNHNPRGDTSEVVGVGVLPAYRRQGLAGAVTAILARHAREHGVTTVFCSAQDEDVARVYEAVGFRRIGTACVAEAD